MTLGDRPVVWEQFETWRQAKNDLLSPKKVRPSSIVDSGSPLDRPDLLGLGGLAGSLANFRYRGPILDPL